MANTPFLQDSPVVSANDAAERVREQAELAASVSCYGIGGIIIENKTGRIINAWGNRAQGRLKSGEYYPLDPSNHGETQLVRWYYDNQVVIQSELGYLPKPSELTVVTSLDPCAMCAGGLCAAGFHVGVIAPDDSGGGVNWDSSGMFPNQPAKIQEKLKSLFGYYKADGISYRKLYQGGSALLFNSETLTQQVYKANVDAFSNSAPLVSATRKEARIKAQDLKDPLNLHAENSTILALKQRFPEALKLRLTEQADISDSGLTPEGTNHIYYRPSLELYSLLQDAVASEPGADNAVAMIDRFGNLLTIGVDKPSTSPIATALMNAVSDYSRFLFELISEASDSAIPFKYKQSDAYNYLTPARDATYIYLKSPSAGKMQTLKDLGLFGSTSEDIIQYIETPSNGTKLDFENQIRGLPIYYLQSSRISTVQSLPEGLSLIVSTGSDAGPGSLRRAIKISNRDEGYQAISFETTSPIRLQSDLPVITGPIDLTGSYNNRRSLIDCNGFAGLRFSKESSGSSLSGLRIQGSRTYGIETKTPFLQIADLRFGNENDVGKSLNQKGSIRRPAAIAGTNLPGWDHSQAMLDRAFDIDSRPIRILSEDTLVSSVRTDKEDVNIFFGFGSVSSGSDQTVFQEFGPADEGSLTSTMIERSVAKGELTEKARRAKTQRLGDSSVHFLDAGLWLPQAKLDDGTPLTLSWLQHSGSSLTGEFRLSMREANKNPELNSLLGKTFQLSWTLPSPGVNTRAQNGEMAAVIMRSTPQPIDIGFYEVDDPLTGMIDGLSPDQPGYEQAALSIANQSKLMLDDPLIGHPLNKRIVTKLEQMNPSQSYGVVVTGLKQTNQIFTSYTAPKDGMLYPFKSFLLSKNRVAIGLEASPFARHGDYADLLLTLPDNISMFPAG
jgi:cytosine deaminase